MSAFAAPDRAEQKPAEAVRSNFESAYNTCPEPSYKRAEGMMIYQKFLRRRGLADHIAYGRPHKEGLKRQEHCSRVAPIARLPTTVRTSHHAKAKARVRT
eukprot:3370388-Pyramimonas_sp.AAC.1